MQCRNHPDREAVAVCQRFDTGYCRECCGCLSVAHCAECTDPKNYCTFRTQCIIPEIARERRRGEDAAANADPLR